MIWLNDNNNLTYNKIISVNDDELERFVQYEQKRYELVRQHYISSLHQYPFYERTKKGFVQYKKVGLATVYDDDGRRWNGASIFTSTYEYKRWLSLNIVLEALGREKYKRLNLNEFFEQKPLDLDNMNSIDMGVVNELYFDYSGFLNIYPWISFEPVNSYNLKQLRSLRKQLIDNGFDASKIEEILRESKVATANSKVLSLTKRLIR